MKVSEYGNQPFAPGQLKIMGRLASSRVVNCQWALFVSVEWDGWLFMYTIADSSRH